MKRRIFSFSIPLTADRVDLIAKKGVRRGICFMDPLCGRAKERINSRPIRRREIIDTMMVKTHLSLSHDPDLKGVPEGRRLPIRDILVFTGAKFLCPVTGAISLMPGTGSGPSFRRIDVNTETGRITGLF